MGSQLKKVDFQGRNVSAISFIMCDLTDASFKDAHCILTNFSGSILLKANFTHAVLNGANLSDTILNDADFRGAILGSAPIVSGANGKKIKDISVNATSAQTINTKFDSGAKEAIGI